MNKPYQKIEALKKDIETTLPDLVRLAESDEKVVLWTQAAFAADYQANEYKLLGKAIKYLGLYGKEITIVPNEQKN